MSWLDLLVPWAAQLGTNSLKAIPLILLLVAMQKWAGRWISPRGMKLLWFLAMIRLFMPEIAATPASIYNLVTRPPPLTAAPPTVPDYTAESKMEPWGPVYSFPPHAPVVVSPPKPTAEAPIRTSAAPAASSSWSRAEIATATWLAGVAVMALLLAGQSWRFHRRFAGLPTCTDPVLLELLEECQKKVGVRTPVALIVSDKVAVPALYRLVRPRILLPATLVRTLTRAQLSFVFQHELAHVSGGDIAINWLVTVAVAAHWCNPFVWLMARCIAQVREMACDRAVLAQRNDPQVYGETIVLVAERLSRPQSVAGVAAIVESRNALQERIRLLTQKQGRNAWLAAWAAALVLAVLFLGNAVQASMAKTVTVPGLPGTGISLADALGKADMMVVGQVVSVKYEGTDAMTDRYWVKINTTQVVALPGYAYLTGFGPPPIEGEVRVTNPAILGNIISGSDVIPAVEEKIPEDGQKYFFFISTDKKTKSNLIFKMLPGGMVVPSAVPEFPKNSATLADILGYPTQYVVIGQFMNMRPRFERAWLEGSDINWEQEFKAVINVKRTLRGKMDPGRIEGDFGYSGSDKLEAGMRPRPTPPEMGKDYLICLSYIEPSENVQERLITGNDLAKSLIFYLSPERPALTSCKITKILPVNAPTAPPAPVASAAILPLPGSSLSVDAAESEAVTIVLGRVTAVSAFFGNSPVTTHFMDVEIHKTLRGKARGAAQYGFPVTVDKEAAPEVGEEYLVFLSNDGEVLKIAPPNAL